MEYDSITQKSILLKMLSAFNGYCEANGLKFTLCFGTLLGAVRHKGFIPWDDDVDIVMPRPDYDRFLKMASDSFMPGYKVIHPQNTPHYYLPFAKVIDCNTSLIEYKIARLCPIGVYLDIFPIDSVPDDRAESEKLFKRYSSLKRKAMETALRYDYLNKMNARRLIKLIRHHFFGLFYSSSQWFDKCEKVAASTAYGSTGHLRIYSCPHFGELVFDRSVFEEFVDLEFEGLPFKGIKNYDSFLTACYQDYMQLPPEGQRGTDHRHYFIDLDRHLSIEEIHAMGY